MTSVQILPGVTADQFDVLRIKACPPEIYTSRIPQLSNELRAIAASRRPRKSAQQK